MIKSDSQEIENSIIKEKITMDQYEELSEKTQNEAKEYVRKKELKEQYMNEIHEIAKEVRKYIKEFFENMIADCIDTKYSSAENISTSELKKRFSLVDISEDKLLSKTGKKLVGGALISRLEKIAKEEKIEIEYKNKIIV